MTVTQATAAPSVVDGPRRWLPPPAVIGAFVVSRILVYGTVGAIVAHRGRTFVSTVVIWDTGWFERISTAGFLAADGSGQQGLPFFPLMPGILSAARWAGVPTWTAGLLVANVAFAAGLWGLYTLMRRNRPEAVANASVWALALFGYGVAFAIVYPDAVVLAASIWAFVLIGRDQPRLGSDVGAALLCALAASARPNGILVAVAVGFALIWKGRHWARAAVVCVPAVVLVGAWMAQLWVWTGNPIVFLSAKSAWQEVTLLEFLDQSNWNTRFHLAAALVAITVVVWQRRKLEAAWLVLAATYLLPSLGLGIVGMGRYTNTVFPVFAAAGEVIAPLPWIARITIYSAGSVLTVAVTWNVISGLWVP